MANTSPEALWNAMFPGFDEIMENKMGHYDEQRQAHAERLRREQMDRERLLECNKSQLGKFIPVASSEYTTILQGNIQQDFKHNIESLVKEMREEIEAIKESLERAYELIESINSENVINTSIEDLIKFTKRISNENE